MSQLCHSHRRQRARRRSQRWRCPRLQATPRAPSCPCPILFGPPCMLIDLLWRGRFVVAAASLPHPTPSLPRAPCTGAATPHCFSTTWFSRHPLWERMRPAKPSCPCSPKRHTSFSLFNAPFPFPSSLIMGAPGRRAPQPLCYRLSSRYLVPTPPPAPCALNKTSEPQAAFSSSPTNRCTISSPHNPAPSIFAEPAPVASLAQAP